MAIALVALVLSVAFVTMLLTRQRERLRPEATPESPPPARKRPTRQEKILQKLEPLPEIPTMMDLVREEIAAEGVDDIPGHEDLPDPVKLKVFRRDHRVIEACTHDACHFAVTEGIERPEATTQDVALRCDQCGELPPLPDTPGTNDDDATLPE